MVSNPAIPGVAKWCYKLLGESFFAKWLLQQEAPLPHPAGLLCQEGPTLIREVVRTTCGQNPVDLGLEPTCSQRRFSTNWIVVFRCELTLPYLYIY